MMNLFKMLFVFNLRIKELVIVLLLVVTFNVSNANANAKDEPQFKIGVNRFAWYAALQTINFMPLTMADPFSGVILTNWYSQNGTERYKVDIYILEENLTAQSVSVKVFKQNKSGNTWVDAGLNQNMSIKIEDSILNTARELRIEYLAGNNK